MLWAVLIGLIVIGLFSTGLGLDADVVLGVIIVLGVISFFVFGYFADDASPEKVKKKEKLKKVLRVLVPIVLIIFVVGVIIGLVGIFDSSSSDAQYDRVMGGYDYGDNYYYDSNDNAVKKTYW